MLLPIAPASLAASVVIASSSPAPTSSGPIPALEVIVAYGKLAGPACYGRVAPAGSSCQLPLSYLKEELGLDDGNQAGLVGQAAALTKEDFGRRLEELPFRWPLKPYGLNEKSLSKTSVMNKGAETALYMDELERRGMYDRRNPTGPLPTSLRPKINDELNKEGVKSESIDAVFRALAGGADELTAAQLERLYQGGETLDYYSFLNVIGPDNVAWPRPSPADTSMQRDR